MFIYVVKRLLAMIPTLLGITLITFFIIQIAPGDPVDASFGRGHGASTEAGGGSDQDQVADAIKAKKELLGMMAKDFVVRAWDGNTAAAALPLDPDDPEHLPADLDLTGRIGSF